MKIVVGIIVVIVVWFVFLEVGVILVVGIGFNV